VINIVEGREADAAFGRMVASPLVLAPDPGCTPCVKSQQCQNQEAEARPMIYGSTLSLRGKPLRRNTV
jgi:hypothetical protein